MATIQERQTKEGSTSFRVQVRLKGFPTQTASFQRKTDAKKWAAQTEAAIREGRHFKTTEAKRHLLNDLIERYIKQVLPTKPKSEYKQSRQLKWWSEQIGAYALCDITPALIAEQRDQFMEGATVRGPKRSPATVNRYLAALSHALAVAVKEWGWLDSNPLSKVRKLKEPRGRVRFLSDEERQRLLQVCKESNNKMLYLIVVLCLSTGARKMEILGLRWEDADLNRNMIVLHETKNNERRVLPLTGYAFELMQAHHKMRSLSTNLVFPNTDGSKVNDIRFHWEEAIKRAEISDFRFHDLRHSAASYLAMNGATMAEIAEVLGHKTLQMVKRYAHLSEAHTASVVSKMNEKIFGGG
jgi:integrase